MRTVGVIRRVCLVAARESQHRSHNKETVDVAEASRPIMYRSVPSSVLAQC